jgi:hypothetical protein
MPRSQAPINLILIGHPEKRMARRRITLGDIERALRSCFEHYPGDKGSTCHVGYGLDRSKGQLKVWTMPPLSHEGDIIVKSVAWKGER